MLILHTTLFEPQTNDLNALDIAIAWAMLKAFSTPHMVIYNCGVESGSSQGHKHVQMFPKQDGKSFGMWPEKFLAANGRSAHGIGNDMLSNCSRIHD